MTTERHIRSIDEDLHPLDDATELGAPPIEADWEDLDEEEGAERSHRREWLAPLLAFLLIGAWTAAFVRAHYLDMAAGGSFEQWTDWIAAWSLPVILVALAWLLYARLSRKEARRFGDAAQALSRQSEELEARLHIVNRELSLAREFLSAQTLELDSLGRMAGDRLSKNADRLQDLVHDNSEQVERIARVSDTALDNMARLRDDLPVIANSARDVSNKIGAAGREASVQLTELVHGFDRLNTFGQASGQQVEALRERTDTVLCELEDRLSHLHDAAATRLSAMEGETSAARDTLDALEVEALNGLHGRMDVLRKEVEAVSADLQARENASFETLTGRLSALSSDGRAFAEELLIEQQAHGDRWEEQIDALRAKLRTMAEELGALDTRSTAASQEHLQAFLAECHAADERLSQREALFDQRLLARRSTLSEIEDQALANLGSRLEQLDQEMAERDAAQAKRLAALAHQGEDLGLRVEAIGERMEAVRERGNTAGEALSAHVAQLSSVLATSREELSATDAAVASLTDGSVRLLELIQASGKHARQELPRAISDFEAGLLGIEQRTADLQDRFAGIGEAGEALEATLQRAEHKADEAAQGVNDARDRFDAATAAQLVQLGEIAARLQDLSERNDALAENARSQVGETLAALGEETHATLARIESVQADAIRRFADDLAEATGGAIDSALEARMAEAITTLTETTQQAERTGRDTAIQLRDQLSRVNELTANLENRVRRAREQAEETIDNDFSRRVALITDSLNSNAIDIGKALSNDVSDTAWAAYMKGDRGVFTRRAVRLLESTTARDIADLYDSDTDFRENVSRFIHDFEAMLRMLLSTRDGQPLGVTVLGSDVGKLYVALAQAIERLRQ